MIAAQSNQPRRPFLMSFISQISEDLKNAMRAKDTVALNVIRNLKSALKYAAIEKLGADGELGDTDALAVVRKEIKKLQDSVDGAEKAGRPEAVEAAKAEIAVLQKYLPAAMSEAELGARLAKGRDESRRRNLSRHKAAPLGRGSRGREVDAKRRKKLVL